MIFTRSILVPVATTSIITCFRLKIMAVHVPLSKTIHFLVKPDFHNAKTSKKRNYKFCIQRFISYNYLFRLTHVKCLKKKVPLSLISIPDDKLLVVMRLSCLWLLSIYYLHKYRDLNLYPIDVPELVKRSSSVDSRKSHLLHIIMAKSLIQTNFIVRECRTFKTESTFYNKSNSTSLTRFVLNLYP